MKKIFITLMAILMIAASLVLAGCNKNQDNNGQEQPEETETGKPIYYSRDSVYAYTLNDNNEATLVAYTGKAANIVVNRIDGKYKIVAIGPGAFAGNTSVKKVEINTPIKSIGEEAFMSCTSLESVTLQSPILETIGKNAFSGCKALTGFAIPSTTKTIGEQAFFKCYVADIDFSKATSLETIGDYAFSFCGMELKSTFKVVLPDNLKELGHGAFFGCTQVEAFEVSANNTMFYSADGVLYSKDRSTLVLYPLGANDGDTYTVPSHVRVIAGSAFAGSTLKNIYFSEGLQEIGGNAFYKAFDLESIELPASVTKIGSYAFMDCSALKSVKLPDGAEIGAFAFRNCSSLTSVKLPSDMKEIPQGLFDSCLTLEEITLPEGLETIGELAFNYCKKLKEIKLPDTVRTVAPYAFRNCMAVTEMDLSFVTSIGSFAFQYCSALQKVVYISLPGM